jgi:NAD(P)-dependent dehydrogenase (short-subunit alcohol dehydrogenase family)
MATQPSQGVTNFDPSRDIPSLAGKIILVTGGMTCSMSHADTILTFHTGTAGLGSESIKAFVAHQPAHIYFTGRNASAANKLIADVKSAHPEVRMTFIEMELSSLRSVKNAITKGFKHDRLDILMNNAGIIAKPPMLSVDGYEIQFATNHLGHAMITKQLLPFLLKAAEVPGSDVRIVSNTSDGYEAHRAIKGGISFEELASGSTMNRRFLGTWQRYGQSKLANILFAAELSRRYPQLTSVVIHPGVVNTPMLAGMSLSARWFNNVMTSLTRTPIIEPHEGAYNQLWCAAGAKKGELRNGGFYRPVGRDATNDLKGEGANVELAAKLWEWTEEVLKKFD